MSFTKDQVLENIKAYKQKIAMAENSFCRTPGSVKLLAATKTVSADMINFAISNGVTLIGENKVQELLEKYDDINKENCEIHFIGSLQTNKVKYIIDKVSMIHSVDSFKLASEISKRAEAKGIVMKVLIEINIGSEVSKSGVLPDECISLIEKCVCLPGIKIMGLMCIPPAPAKCENISISENLCQNAKKIYNSSYYFQKIQQLIIDISEKKLDNVYMDILSMGMSGDFEEAIANGSTMVRIGSGIFGKRIYPESNN